MKKLLLGNEAVARGLYEAGCSVISSYPGTPSTEITEYAATYDDMYAEWAPNEKVAMEVAIGASVAGARSFCGMKHVGLNVAADPFFTVSYTGINGGMVVAVADDPGMHSSQNEQDSRHHGIAAKVMVLEPSNSAECLEFTKKAFELSEMFDTPVLLRLTTRVAHSRGLCELGERKQVENKEYVKDPMKYVMMPAMAIKRHVVVEQRLLDQAKWAESCELNRTEINSTKIGIIANGISYEYAKEALGDNASYLKLGCTNPLPTELIKSFAQKCEKVYVIEELDDIIESHCLKIGVEVTGKELFSRCGEFSQAIIAEKILGEKAESLSFGEDLPNRPPSLCAGCPHRGLYNALKNLKVRVSGDIGCYTLGALPPFQSIDTCVCMGASVSMLHGMSKADKAAAKNSVAVIGDSTFMHSGITSLIDIAYNMGNTTAIVLDNSITGMTGHQQNPTTGKTLKGDPTSKVSIEKLANAVGIERVRVVDPYDIPATQAAIAEELSVDEPSLVISRRPCVLLKDVKTGPALEVVADKCKSCKACMKIGCPAISFVDGKASIDFTQCTGCNMCTHMCKFDAIKVKEGK